MAGFVNTSNERLYLTSDRNTVVREGDPRAAFVLVGPGGTVLPEEAQRLNLYEFDLEPEVKANAPAENKANQPAQNKTVPEVKAPVKK